ncbi:MAG: cytochrome c oxidase subunit II [Phyllobacteriaceae bacterium]|nr:cytochrome c oxidase subunit II [Phyllobacteriaceae bacterium]MBA91719.1 cytochrome c oxidase subunit II [Phyllobacteriaceae bacterium]
MNFRWFPEQASSIAPSIDVLFFALVAFSGALGVFLSALVIGYAVRYREGSPADRSGQRKRNMALEIGWTSASVVTAFVIFAYGARLFVDHQRPPGDALRISAIGKQWMWKFRHPGGQREINTLHVPLGQPVQVTLGSQDVIHSFFVPAFRVKQDAVPGRSTRVWFTPTKEGRFRLFCAEYCGTQHSAMGGWIVVMKPEDFTGWLARQGESTSLAQQGAELFRALGCSGCHGQSSEMRAPSLKGLFGRPVPLASGQTVIADEAYIRDSILMPQKQVAAGYAPVMPSFDGLIEEGELQMLVAHIRSLGGSEADDN